MTEEIEKFPLLKNAIDVDVRFDKQMDELHYLVAGTLHGDDVIAFLEAVRIMKVKTTGIPNKGY